MKVRRLYLKFTNEMKRTVRRCIIYGQYSPKQICVDEKKRFGDF